MAGASHCLPPEARGLARVPSTRTALRGFFQAAACVLLLASLGVGLNSQALSRVPVRQPALSLSVLHEPLLDAESSDLDAGSSSDLDAGSSSDLDAGPQAVQVGAHPQDTAGGGSGPDWGVPVEVLQGVPRGGYPPTGSLSLTSIPPGPSAEASPPLTHRVGRGETLGEIAELYGLDWLTLAKANALSNPNQLQIGQLLTIPEGDDVDQDWPAAPVVLDAVYRSQKDGSVYAGANCGPATLGMFLTAFGDDWATSGVRRSVNEQMGIWSPDVGSTWEALAYAARVRGYGAHRLYDATGEKYRVWTIDDLAAEVSTGRPVMLLVRFRSLPGHEYSDYYGDHYILFLGLDEVGRVVYHDSAFNGQDGAFSTMSQERLMKAWTGTAAGIRRSAMALRPIAD